MTRSRELGIQWPMFSGKEVNPSGEEVNNGFPKWEMRYTIS
jgi:hypothetical protein